MKQFDFETNIEKRSPFTGNVFTVDRMTSDWAERHPLNVDQFIEDVYQEFAGSEFEESREALRKVWTATLQMPVRGDKTVYPNNNGAHRPAAMKVWHSAGDYWRRGLRLGDTLPDRMPSCKITRLDDGGWIALFPKDLHLLDNCYNTAAETTEVEEPEVEAVAPTTTVATTEEEPSAVLTPEPAIEVQAPQTQNRTEETVHPVSQRRRRREQRMTQREAQRLSYEARLEREAQEAEEAAREEERKKIFAAVAAAAVTLIMIHFFGLLGPAVFGLLAGGLLKG